MVHFLRKDHSHLSVSPGSEEPSFVSDCDGNKVRCDRASYVRPRNWTLS
jgi:hypothetical protein